MWRRARSSSSKAMEVLRTPAEFRKARKGLPADVTIGLVPTMGGLHAGHQSLVRAARERCDVVVASIFVNPLQFGPEEDFDKYPRQEEQDVALLKDEGVDMVLMPSVQDMYPLNYRCVVTPQGFDAIPEGRVRPGHFGGVATVVTKLLNIVQPTSAFFGEKDAAQCVLIQRLVRDLNMDVDVHIVPVAREEDGLALSTRNQYLSQEERAVAGVVYRGLRRAKEYFDSSEQLRMGAEELSGVIRNEYAQEPLLTRVQYISVASRETMEEIDQVDRSGGAVVSVGVQLGKCRLIDTITL